jgi:hypothetical protein
MRRVNQTGIPQAATNRFAHSIDSISRGIMIDLMESLSGFMVKNILLCSFLF